MAARASRAHGAAPMTCRAWRTDGGLLPAAATDAAGQHEGVGPEADRDVDHGEDEEHRGEQPRPGVLAEPEPRLAGVLGGPDQQRTEDRAEGRHEDDPAHRPAAVAGLGEVGGGVAGQQVRRLPAAEQEQPEQEHGQLLALGADRRDQPAGRGEGVAELEAGAAPSTAHQARQRLGQERSARRDRGGGDAGPRRLLAEHVLDDEGPDRDRGCQRRGADDLTHGQDAQHPALERGPLDLGARSGGSRCRRHRPHRTAWVGGRQAGCGTRRR